MPPPKPGIPLANPNDATTTPVADTVRMNAVANMMPPDTAAVAACPVNVMTAVSAVVWFVPKRTIRIGVAVPAAVLDNVTHQRNSCPTCRPNDGMRRPEFVIYVSAANPAPCEAVAQLRDSVP